jgi:WD40 repeat protein
VAASPDGTRALAACGDGTVVEWDVVTGVERAAFPAHAGAARAAAYGGGALLGAAVSGGDDGVVRLWTVDETSETSDETSDSKNRSSSFRGHAGRVTGIAVGGETSGDVVVSCGVDRAALLWDVRRGVPKASFVGHEGALTSVALGAGDAFDSSGGGLLCTTGSDRAVRFWDARAGNGNNACVRVLNLEAVPVACASCVSQPRWFATCGADGLTVLDARVFREVAHFEGLAPLTALAFHGESVVFAGDADGRLYALDVWKAPPRSWE